MSPQWCAGSSFNTDINLIIQLQKVAPVQSTRNIITARSPLERNTTSGREKKTALEQKLRLTFPPFLYSHGPIMIIPLKIN